MSSNEKNGRTVFTYTGVSHFQPSTREEEPQVLRLFTNTNRPVRAHIVIQDKGAFREAMNALMLVLEPGFEYRPSSGNTGTISYDSRAANLAKARDTYCKIIQKNDPQSWLGMDPVVSISQKGILIEGLSMNAQDMASVFVPATAYEIKGELVLGCSNIDVGPELVDGLLQITTKRTLEVVIGGEQEKRESYAKYFGSVNKSFLYPNSWKREILQCMAASSLDSPNVTFSRIDFFNVLRHLRLNKTEKGDSEKMQIALIKGVAPEIQLDPWGWKVKSNLGPYTGEKSAYIGFYDRDKLRRLEPLIPFIERVNVRLMGDALPAFWTLNSKSVCYTYGTLGYNPINWARGLFRDQVLRRDTQNPAGYESILSMLEQKRNMSIAELVTATNIDSDAVQKVLVRAIQNGVVASNAGVGRYQIRNLFVRTDIEKLRFGPKNRGYKDEKLAYELVESGRVQMDGRITVSASGEVDFAKEIRNFERDKNGDVQAKFSADPVVVTEPKKSFQTEDPQFNPKLQLDAKGAVRKPGCTCAYMDVMRAEGKKPICSHLQAIWIHYCREYVLGEQTGIKSLAQSMLIQLQDGELGQAHRLRLRARRLIDEWGSLDELNSGRPERRVRMYQRQEDAYSAFLNRIADLESQGFVNAG
ncbi:MAG: hypothetical protein VX278_23700 [Myxococcota bacterium]|nr:hypothetical protein [Myxococcota bacterium]